MSHARADIEIKAEEKPALSSEELNIVQRIFSKYPEEYTAEEKASLLTLIPKIKNGQVLLAIIDLKEAKYLPAKQQEAATLLIELSQAGNADASYLLYEGYTNRRYSYSFPQVENYPAQANYYFQKALEQRQPQALFSKAHREMNLEALRELAQYNSTYSAYALINCNHSCYAPVERNAAAVLAQFYLKNKSACSPELRQQIIQWLEIAIPFNGEHYISKAAIYRTLAKISGDIYANAEPYIGWSVATNLDIAIYRYKQARSPEAYFKLGQIYEHGASTIPKNSELAAKWYRRCVEQNDLQGLQALVSLVKKEGEPSGVTYHAYRALSHKLITHPFMYCDDSNPTYKKECEIALANLKPFLNLIDESLTIMLDNKFAKLATDNPGKLCELIQDECPAEMRIVDYTHQVSWDAPIEELAESDNIIYTHRWNQLPHGRYILTNKGLTTLREYVDQVTALTFFCYPAGVSSIILNYIPFSNLRELNVFEAPSESISDVGQWQGFLYSAWLHFNKIPRSAKNEVEAKIAPQQESKSSPPLAAAVAIQAPTPVVMTGERERLFKQSKKTPARLCDSAQSKSGRKISCPLL